MSFFYYKTGGTATGDAGRYASAQTGSFASLGASNYYDSLASVYAATTPPTSGDVVIASDLHLQASSVAREFSEDGVIYLACDDANIDQPRTSGNYAQEEVTGATNDINFTGSSTISGYHLTSGDDILFNNDMGTRVSDCILEVTGSGDIIRNNGDGRSAYIADSEIRLQNASSQMRVDGGSSFTIQNTNVTTISAGITNLFSAGFANGGGNVDWRDSDISSVTGTIIGNVGADSLNDDAINCFFSRITTASGVAWHNEDFQSDNQSIVAIACGRTDAEREYGFFTHRFGGDVNHDTGTYRNEDEAFPVSGDKVSYEIITNADASELRPFYFDFPVSKYIELSTAGNRVITFAITSDDMITDKDIIADIYYSDGTNYANINKISTAPQTVGGGFDFFSTANLLPFDFLSTWTNGLLFNQSLTVDTSSAIGSDSAPTVRIYVTKPSTIININLMPLVS